ncbi:hypothetical protein [Pedobacter terrae]|uniref:hypothetical protein n=1 Tax=Pedobacter terrae TaxID=405671 RepID=UPI002FFB2BA0
MIVYIGLHFRTNHLKNKSIFSKGEKPTNFAVILWLNFEPLTGASKIHFAHKNNLIGLFNCLYYLLQNFQQSNVALKIICYIIYTFVFTYCYCYLNAKLKTKTILIGYPIFLIVSIYPVKIWLDHIRQIYNETFTQSWLKIILMSIAAFTLFNLAYGIISIMVNAQVGFHQKYGKPPKNPVKFFLKNADSVKGAYLIFFYIGGILLGGIIFWKY